MNRRVVVTGIGLVSALGIGTSETWAALLAGQSGVTRITKFDISGYATQIAAEVKGFDPLAFIEKKDIKKMDLFIQYAIAAAQFAMDDSRLEITNDNAPNIGNSGLALAYQPCPEASPARRSSMRGNSPVKSSR